MWVISSQIFRSRLGQRDVLLRPVPGVLRSSEFSPYHTRMIFVAKKQLFIKTNLLAAACHWANSSSSRPRRGVRSLSSCWSPVVSSRNVLVGFDCSDCKVPIPSCNEFLNISSLLTITRLWFTEVFRWFNHVESMFFRIFTLWYELYLKRYDTLSSFRGTNQPKFGMFPYKWNPWSWRELSKGAGKQRQSDIRIPKIAMKFWPRFCFELDSSGTTLLWRSWMPGRVARSSLPEALKYHIVDALSIEVTTWSPPELSCLCRHAWNQTRLQTSHRTSLNESHEYDSVWPKNCCRGFDHESWHDSDMTFAFVWLCGVHLR